MEGLKMPNDTFKKMFPQSLQEYLSNMDWVTTNTTLTCCNSLASDTAMLDLPCYRLKWAVITQTPTTDTL